MAPGGRVCAICPWYRFCRGCEIRCTDEPLLHGLLQSFNSQNGVNDYLELHNDFSSVKDKLKNSDEIPSLKQTNSLNCNGSTANLVENSDCKGDAKFLNEDDMLHISIDWDPTALHLRYQTTREKVIKNIEYQI